MSGMITGILVTYPDTSVSFGCVFLDGEVYIHEPVCDTYGNMDDCKRGLESYWRGVSTDPYSPTYEQSPEIEIVGPLVALEAARRNMEEQYEEGKKALERDHQYHLQWFEEYETESSKLADIATIGKKGVE